MPLSTPSDPTLTHTCPCPSPPLLPSHADDSSLKAHHFGPPRTHNHAHAHGHGHGHGHGHAPSAGSPRAAALMHAAKQGGGTGPSPLMAATNR